MWKVFWHMHSMQQNCAFFILIISNHSWGFSLFSAAVGTFSFVNKSQCVAWIKIVDHMQEPIDANSHLWLAPVFPTHMMSLAAPAASKIFLKVDHGSCPHSGQCKNVVCRCRPQEFVEPVEPATTYSKIYLQALQSFELGHTTESNKPLEAVSVMAF